MKNKFFNEGIIFLGISEKLRIKPEFFHKNFFHEDSAKIYGLYYLNFFLKRLNLLNGAADKNELYKYVPVCLDIYIDSFNTFCSYADIKNEKIKEIMDYIKTVLKKIKKINKYIIRESKQDINNRINIRFINIMMKKLVNFIDNKKIDEFIKFTELNIDGGYVKYNKKIDGFSLTSDMKNIFKILKIKTKEGIFYYPFITDNIFENVYLNEFLLESNMCVDYTGFIKYFYMVKNEEKFEESEEKQSCKTEEIEKELTDNIFSRLEKIEGPDIEKIFYAFDFYEKAMKEFFIKNISFTKNEIKILYKNVLKNIMENIIKNTANEFLQLAVKGQK